MSRNPREPRLESRLPDVETTIFTVMSQLAQEHGAINLGQGTPDFDPPQGLRDRVARFMSEGFNQYAPMPGVPALRGQIAGLVQRRYGADVDPDDEVTVTCGATEALFAGMAAVLRAEDEVIVFEPAYDAYDPGARLQGARVLRVPLAPPDFRPDWNRVAHLVSRRTRLVVINSPHNPTGTLLTRDDLNALADILAPTDALVLSDEVYEHMVFDGRPHASVLTHEELRARAMCVFSFGKTFHATGWKVGYCIAPPGLTHEFRKMHQYLTFAIMTPVQHALADFLSDDGGHIHRLSDFYQHKRDVFRTALAESRFQLGRCEGTYFQLADYGAISDRPDLEFARRLTIEHGVAVIPLSPFYGSPDPSQRLIRFSFAKDDDVLRRAGERLCRI